MLNHKLLYLKHWYRNVSRRVAGLNFKLGLSCTCRMSNIIAAEFKVGGWQCSPSLHSVQTTLSILLLGGLGHVPQENIWKLLSWEWIWSSFDENLRSCKAYGGWPATSSTSPGSVPVRVAKTTEYLDQNCEGWYKL